MSTSTGPTLLAQIDTELQSIQAKLRDGSATGSNLGALIATMVTNEAITNAVTDTLTTNVDTTNTVLDALVLGSGTGLGKITEVPLDDDLHTWIAAAIVTET